MNHFYVEVFRTGWLTLLLYIALGNTIGVRARSARSGLIVETALPTTSVCLLPTQLFFCSISCVIGMRESL
jgi:hypothetical protein